MDVGHSRTSMLTSVGRAASSVAVIAILIIGGIGNVGQHAPAGELADVGSFLHAGDQARAGLNPYEPYAHGTNLNAPFSVIPFQWAAHFNAEVVYKRWYLVSLCIYALVVLLLWRAYPENRTVMRVAWATVWGSLWSTLWDGQIYTVLTLVTTGAWLLMEKRRPIAAGLLIGVLCAVKPNYLVWPVLLAISGAWSAALAGGVAAVVLTAIPGVFYGPGIYRQWLVAAAHIMHATAPANASLLGALARVNAPTWAGELAGAVLLLALAFWAWRTKPTPARVSGAALAAAILASPLGWIDYTLLLLPVFWSRRWTWPWWCAALLLVQFVGNTWWMLRAPPWVLASLGQYGTAAVLLVLLGVLHVPRGQPRGAAVEHHREGLAHTQQGPVEAF